MFSVRRPAVAYTAGDAIPPSNLTRGQVEEFARAVAAAANFSAGENPADLTTRLGGRIQYQDLGDILAEGGSIFVHGPNDFDILLPHYTSPVRDRFTVAHELGHYYLHSGQGETPLIAYRSGSSRIEWEANWFAAALLMPKGQFAAVWKESSDLAAVARRFGVSEEAARVRKGVLGL